MVSGEPGYRRVPVSGADYRPCHVGIRAVHPAGPGAVLRSVPAARGAADGGIGAVPVQLHLCYQCKPDLRPDVRRDQREPQSGPQLQHSAPQYHHPLRALSAVRPGAAGILPAEEAAQLCALHRRGFGGRAVGPAPQFSGGGALHPFAALVYQYRGLGGAGLCGPAAAVRRAAGPRLPLGPVLRRFLRGYPAAADQLLAGDLQPDYPAAGQRVSDLRVYPVFRGSAAAAPPREIAAPAAVPAGLGGLRLFTNPGFSGIPLGDAGHQPVSVYPLYPSRGADGGVGSDLCGAVDQRAAVRALAAPRRPPAGPRRGPGASMAGHTRLWAGPHQYISEFSPKKEREGCFSTAEYRPAQARLPLHF